MRGQRAGGQPPPSAGVCGSGEPGGREATQRGGRAVAATEGRLGTAVGGGGDGREPPERIGALPGVGGGGGEVEVGAGHGGRAKGGWRPGGARG